jgi:hypothetical protein
MVHETRVTLSWSRSPNESSLFHLLRRLGIRVMRGRVAEGRSIVEAVLPGSLGRVKEVLRQLQDAGMRVESGLPASTTG